MRTIRTTTDDTPTALCTRGRPVARRVGALSLLILASLAATAGAAPQFHGPALRGTLSVATAGAAPRRVDLEITHFAGDTVHAISHGTPGSGAGRPGRALRLHARELVGLRWSARECDASGCETITYRITGAASDTSENTMPAHGDNSDVWLYRVEYARASAPGQWRGACGAEPSDMGMFVDGRWSADGSWDSAGWTFSCPDGVIAKCVRSWGYKPWKTLDSPACGEVDLRVLHQACTRAARADYCGDGISHTRDGTMVDMFDTCGLNVRVDVPGFAEESAFDLRGALWVSVPRWPTGSPTETGWDLGTCELPREDPDRAGDALIHIWSDPKKGRDSAGAGAGAGPGR